MGALWRRALTGLRATTFAYRVPYRPSAHSGHVRYVLGTFTLSMIGLGWGGLALAQSGPPNGLANAGTACPPVLGRPEVTRVATDLAARLNREASRFTESQAIGIIRQQLAGRLQFDLPSKEFATIRSFLNALDAESLTRCLPALASTMDRPASVQSPEIIRQPSGSPAAPSRPPRGGNDYDDFVRLQRREKEAREQERQERTRLVQQRAEDDRVRRAEELRQRDTLQRDEAIERQRVAEEERVLRAEEQRQREVGQRADAEERKRQADEQGRRRTAKLKEDEDRSREEDEARLAKERERAEQIKAARLARPECREADRVAMEEKAVQAPIGEMPLVFQMSTKFAAGMRPEACVLARKAYVSFERLRSATARCEPVEAIIFSESSIDLRRIIVANNC